VIRAVAADVEKRKVKECPGEVPGRMTFFSGSSASAGRNASPVEQKSLSYRRLL
jgi:hypothetical protein